MIEPTVGRKIWYWPSTEDKINFLGLTVYEGQPFDATIVGVHSSTQVNLVVHDAVGVRFPKAGVSILPEDAGATGGGYAQWMPFQLGQAKQTTSAPAVDPDAQQKRYAAIQVAMATVTPAEGVDALLANSRKIEAYIRGDSAT